MKTKTKIYSLTLVLLAVVLIIWLSSTGFATKVLWRLSNEGNWLLPLIVISALIDSINPCAFSILILTIAFLFSIGGSRLKIIQIGSAYIIGIFIIYILIGLGILQTLHLFNTPHFMAKVGAGALILFGLINVINEIFPNFPIKLRIPHAAHSRIAKLMEKASLPTAFLLGALVGICEFPCTGGPYLMVLGLLHDQKTYLTGLWYLLLYNLIFILPLAIILVVASNNKLLEKVRVWQQTEKKDMRLFASIAMIVLGIIILGL